MGHLISVIRRPLEKFLSTTPPGTFYKAEASADYKDGHPRSVYRRGKVVSSLKADRISTGVARRDAIRFEGGDNLDSVTHQIMMC